MSRFQSKCYPNDKRRVEDKEPLGLNWHTRLFNLNRAWEETLPTGLGAPMVPESEEFTV